MNPVTVTITALATAATIAAVLAVLAALRLGSLHDDLGDEHDPDDTTHTPTHHRHEHQHSPREPRPVLISPGEVVRGWWGNWKEHTETPKGDNTPPITVVWWWDAIAYGTDNWTDDTEHPEACPTISIGWLTHNTPQHITIIPLVNNDQWGHGITIPHGCIHHITTIPTPRTRRNTPKP